MFYIQRFEWLVFFFYMLLSVCLPMYKGVVCVSQHSVPFNPVQLCQLCSAYSHGNQISLEA